jgi:hypothetical protein
MHDGGILSLERSVRNHIQGIPPRTKRLCKALAKPVKANKRKHSEPERSDRPASGSNLTFESRRGFPIELALRHNFKRSTLARLRGLAGFEDTPSL